MQAHILAYIYGKNFLQTARWALGLHYELDLLTHTHTRRQAKHATGMGAGNDERRD